MSEFAHVCIYLVISPLVYLIPLGVPFASNSSTCPEKLSANKCGWMRLLPLTRGRWLDGATTTKRMDAVVAAGNESARFRAKIFCSSIAKS
jgi:hypothetical protein